MFKRNKNGLFSNIQLRILIQIGFSRISDKNGFHVMDLYG